MEKIILVCRESGSHGHTIAMIEALFPECTVEIVMEPVGELDSISGSVKSMSSSFQIAPFLWNC
jgi:hypothetical protein